MISVVQRVTRAEVDVGGTCIGKIERGVLALVAVEKGDRDPEADRLAERLVNFRLFPDRDDRMNLSVKAVEGALLLVPQFTLAADTRKGTRASFAGAAPPKEGERLFRRLVEATKQRHPRVACGQFGADMKVSLVNDGPVTFVLRAAPVL
jgi:D-tyrosyl-tRNA(Tyr) deacylase